MPPGRDGVETARAMWKVDPDLQVVLCTAYSDYAWEDMVSELGLGDNFLILKKPFDAIEVRQLAQALAEKWFLSRENEIVLKWVEQQVRNRNEKLEHALARLETETSARLRLERDLRREHKLDVLGRLVASIGHEINNPLAYVMANVEYARQELQQWGGRPPAAGVESLCAVLEEAASGAERIRRIVRSIRDFSQVGDEPLSSVDVRQSVEAALRLVGNQIRHRARLIAALGEPCLVRADPLRLEQVMVNLLMNAVQSLRDDADNEIRVTVVVDQARRVEIAISDTGSGISSSDLERVFDPFFSTRAKEGTGLGLWICRKILESFGGVITIESVLGKGTVVRASLPALAPTQREPRDVRGHSRPASPDATAPRARILLVDDEPAVLRGLKRQLGCHDVSITTSAREAVEVYKAREFDFVFCDLMMPGFGGIELLAEFERLGCEHAARVVLMTGGIFTEGVREALASIKNPCIQKPFDTSRVLRWIERRLRQSGDARLSDLPG